MSKFKGVVFFPECKNILMRLERIIVVTFSKVIPKFGFDQTNMS